MHIVVFFRCLWPTCALIIASPGVSECILTEFLPNIDYKNFAALLSSIIKQQQNLKHPVCCLDKSLLAGLLKMCGSDRERELLRYTAVKSSGLSATQAYKQLGLQNMDQRITKVDNVIEHAKFICWLH